MGDSKHAYLLYPGLTLCLAYGPAVYRALGGKQKAKPAWVSDERVYQLIMQAGQEGALLATNMLLLAITEQIPKIVKRQQQVLLPEGLVICHMGAVGAMILSMHLGARSFAK